VLTYTTALRRFFGDGGVLRRWRNPMMMMMMMMMMTGFAMAVFWRWRCIAPWCIPMWGGFFNGYVFVVRIKNNDSPDWRGRYLKNYV